MTGPVFWGGGRAILTVSQSCLFHEIPQNATVRVGGYRDVPGRGQGRGHAGDQRGARAAVAALAERFGRLSLSPVYESAAEGFAGDPFLNLVAGFDTVLGVGELRAELRAGQS